MICLWSVWSFDLIIGGNFFFRYFIIVLSVDGLTFCKKLQQKKLLLPFVSFHAGDGTDSSNHFDHFDQIVSTNAANRDPLASSMFKLRLYHIE